MSVVTKFRVAICGGGIGGLCFALALAPYEDIEIDLYEAAATFREIGAGIGIWGQGIAALRELGLEKKIRAIATAAPGEMEGIVLELRRSDQPAEGELFGYLGMSTNLGLHRSQFIDLLVELLSETKRVNIHFGKRCISFKQRLTSATKDDNLNKDPVTIQFLDGSSATCDVLVGCDGIKSAVRGELVYGSTTGVTNGGTPGTVGDLKRFVGTSFCGTVAYRTLVKPEELRAVAGEHSAITTRKMYCGKGKHIVTYPVGGGKFLNFLAYSSDPARQADWGKGSWVVEANKEELLEQFQDFEPEVQALLKCVDKSSRWAMYDLEPLTSWSKGCVTLLGDAAHATTPFLGAGGGQVLEDAYVLSRLLGSPLATRDTIPAVLLAYERVRLPRANKVILSSREARRAFEFLNEYNGGSNEKSAQALSRVSEWMWEGKGEPNDDVQEGERLIRESLGSTEVTACT
ncbi:FAD/NAD(P)-binding domain-containing protein [Ramaria rubella]|nr:FAD/NAD(P)-binding domain-containing protein [Ramaria rubella]